MTKMQLLFLVSISLSIPAMLEAGKTKKKTHVVEYAPYYTQGKIYKSDIGERAYNNAVKSNNKMKAKLNITEKKPVSAMNRREKDQLLARMQWAKNNKNNL